MNCLACSSAVQEELQLICAPCKGSYHYTCVGIQPEYYQKHLRNVKHDWRCPSCLNNITRRQRSDNTPVRKHYEPPSPGRSNIDNTDMSIVCDESPKEDYSRIEELVLRSQMANNISIEASMRNLTESVSTMLDTKLGVVKQDLAIINSKLNTTKQEIFREIKNEFNLAIGKIKQEFSDTTEFLSEQITSFKTDLNSISVKVQELASENSRLNSELLNLKKSQKSLPATSELHEIVDQMKAEINDRDQALLRNDVEISGIPEYKVESTIHLVKAIAQKLGITIEERDIVSANRVGRIHQAISTENEPDAESQSIPEGETSHGSETNTGRMSRPRPLAVRFTRRAVRDELLQNARTRRGLDSSNIGLPEHTPVAVYINERLTKTNRRIFWKGRQAASAAKWKFVWTKEGRIYAKRTDTNESKKVHIKLEKDIVRVFGIDPTIPIIQ